MNDTLITQVILAAATLGASLGGYLLAGNNERRKDQRALRREMEFRTVDRAARREDELHTIQRETLLSLQDALQLAARLCGRALHFDHLQARKNQFTQLPEELSNDMHANGIEVKRLATRIVDHDIRSAINEFHDECVRLSTLPDYLEGHTGDELERRALKRMSMLVDAYARVTETLGTAIRTEITWRPSTLPTDR